MGVAYYLTTEVDIDGFDPTDFGGKALAKADDYLEEAVCKPLGLRALVDFMGDDPRDLLGDEDFEDVPEENLAEQWFDAAEGLASVDAMLAHLRRHPGVIPQQARAEEELAQVKAVLETCRERGIRWHMSMDF